MVGCSFVTGYSSACVGSCDGLPLLEFSKCIGHLFQKGVPGWKDPLLPGFPCLASILQGATSG